ncbi:MAG: hypothetical protein Q7U75_18540, partial [Desulfobacterales bacterium]|nr:hypothetical protein [Desulfobacterales bacterium]
MERNNTRRNLAICVMTALAPTGLRAADSACRVIAHSGSVLVQTTAGATSIETSGEVKTGDDVTMISEGGVAFLVANAQ